MPIHLRGRRDSAALKLSRSFHVEFQVLAIFHRDCTVQRLFCRWYADLTWLGAAWSKRNGDGEDDRADADQGQAGEQLGEGFEPIIVADTGGCEHGHECAVGRSNQVA